MSTTPAPDDVPHNNHELVKSDDPDHAANLVPALSAKFWSLGWMPGTGGGCSVRDGDHIYIAPSGVSKELMKPTDLYVLSLSSQDQSNPRERTYVRSPPAGKPSQCTPLFLASYRLRNAGCCIHTHSKWAVLVTLILEARGPGKSELFEINNMEQIKGFGKGYQLQGNLGYYDTLRIPVIENTAQEEDLTPYLEEAIDKYPNTYAVLARRHGVYVWGDNVMKAKAMCESLDYLFQLAVEMHKLGLPWISDVPRMG